MLTDRVLKYFGAINLSEMHPFVCKQIHQDPLELFPSLVEISLQALAASASTLLSMVTLTRLILTLGWYLMS